MLLNHIILAVLWILYGVLHSVLAGPAVKKMALRRMKNFKWYRLWYTLFAFISLGLLLYYQTGIPTLQLFPITWGILITGMVVSFAGLMLMLICIRKYFMSLSGLRSLLIEEYSNQLQVSGVHTYVRHPLYLGTFAFIWGLFLLLPYLSLLIAVSIITVYTLAAIRLEERKLVAEFGESYRHYQSTVPMLLPFSKHKRRS